MERLIDDPLEFITKKPKTLPRTCITRFTPIGSVLGGCEDRCIWSFSIGLKDPRSQIPMERLDSEPSANLKTKRPKKKTYIQSEMKTKKKKGERWEGEGAEAPNPVGWYTERGFFFQRFLMGFLERRLTYMESNK